MTTLITIEHSIQLTVLQIAKSGSKQISTDHGYGSRSEPIVHYKNVKTTLQRFKELNTLKSGENVGLGGHPRINSTLIMKR